MHLASNKINKEKLKLVITKYCILQNVKYLDLFV